MPSLKRPCSVPEDSDGEIFETESAQSSLRQRTRKKLRLSAADEESELSDRSTDEELHNFHATQFREKQERRGKKDNVPADNGIIESVTCTNFMCHGYLEVAIGPLINFIVGHNGSGKSAVLTAISICLGGKASNTNRAGNLKAFIKEGQESCTLSIKLKNRGDTAYQQDMYGESIIVERYFNKAGTSGFKLKNITGRIISTKKGDLEAICDYFALQIDNPMTILTQDLARQFLNNSSPQEKYKFFIRGVQLEQLSQDYALLEEYIDLIESTFTDKRNDIGALSTSASKARELLSMSEKQNNLRAKSRSLARQMAWAQVEDQERFLASYDEDLRKMGQKIEDAERKVTKTSENFDTANEAYERAQGIVQKIKKELGPIYIEKGSIKAEHDSVKVEALATQTEQRKIKDSMKEGDKRIGDLNKEITDENRRLEEAHGGSHTRRLAELEESKDKVKEARADLDQHSQLLRNLEFSKNRATEAVEKLQESRQDKRNNIQQGEADLQTLARDRGNQRRGYPAGMDQLIKAVRQDDGFDQTPTGPIGDSVRLLKPVWSNVLEKQLGAALNSFIVTNKRDQNRLSSIMQRVRWSSCPIFIGNNHLFDYSNHEPDQEYETTLRVLEIDNPVVLRQLIINHSIEQTLLIEDNQKAVDVMDRARLRNVKQCFSLGAPKPDGNLDSNRGVRLTYGWQNTLSSSGIEPFKGAPRMKTDVEYQINAQRGELQRCERELWEIDQKHRVVQSTLENCQRAIAQHHKRTKELQLEIARAEALVDDLQDALDQDSVEEGRLDALKNALAEAMETKTMVESSYQESVNQKDKHKESVGQLKMKMDDIDARINEVDMKVKKAEARFLKMTNERHASLLEKNSSFHLLEEAKHEKDSVEEERTVKLGIVESFTAQASKVSNRVPIDPGETYTSLEKKYSKIEEDLKKYNAKLGGDQRKIAEDCARAVKSYNDALIQFKEEETLAQLLKVTLVDRTNRWELFRRHITARARVNFTYLLSERSFRGQLSIDHKSRLLDLKVQPDETVNAEGRQTKTLSGGEKSFSTICLLLSLWEAMGAPIRCLDEFDVFMDSVNRDVSMKKMIGAARRSVGRQYIFITPGAMGSVDREVDVKVILMKDPERNQSTITFSNS